MLPRYIDLILNETLQCIPVIKQFPKVLEASQQIQQYQRLLIEVLEKSILTEEDRWECAGAMKNI